MSESCRGCWITDGAAPHKHTHTHYIDREISIYWRISSNTPDDDQLETKHRRYYLPLLLLIPVLLTTDHYRVTTTDRCVLLTTTDQCVSLTTTDHHRVTTTDRWGQSVEELVGSTGADQWTSSDELFLLPSSTHHTSTNDINQWTVIHWTSNQLSTHVINILISALL